MLAKRLFIYILAIALSACTTNEKEDTGAFDNDTQTTIPLYFQDTLKKTKALKQADDVLRFYRETNYELIWSDNFVITPTADSLFLIFSNALSYGLDTADYHFPQLTTIHTSITHNPTAETGLWLKWEMLMTDAWFVFGKHLAEGRLDSIPEHNRLPRNRLLTGQIELLKNACKNNSQVKALLALQPQHPEYIKLQRALALYIKQYELTDSVITVTVSKTDSVFTYHKAVQALQRYGFLHYDSTQPAAIREAIKKFQVMYGLTADGKIGINTAAALSESNLTRYKKAAVSLEKWRWIKAPTGHHIIVNIPAYTLSIYNHDSLQKKHKVIVGNPKARTPVLESRLEYFITYPFWYVPYSITSKELLPKIKQDNTYLEKNNYEILGKNKEIIDPASIKWEKMDPKNFPYMLRQKGGNKNSLGLIKFMFPNKHSVYLHDTPAKSLFNMDIRAFSHGCIRLQEPIKFADYLLTTDNNKTVADTVISLINRQERKIITLKQPVPLYILYITCTGNEDGSIIFHKDIYEHDQAIINRMFPEK